MKMLAITHGEFNNEDIITIKDNYTQGEYHKKWSTIFSM